MIEQIAQLCQTYLVRKEREDGSTFICQTDDAPEWFDDLVRAAHLDMLPNDWSYTFIESAIDQIEEGVEIEEIEYSRPVNWKLTDWFGSHGYRPEYADNAIRDFGEMTCHDAMAIGMETEFREVASIVYDYLADYAEDAA